MNEDRYYLKLLGALLLIGLLAIGVYGHMGKGPIAVKMRSIHSR